MADYAKTTWVENVTKVGPTNLNKMEAGIDQAGRHARFIVPAPSSLFEDLQVEWKRAVGGALIAYKRVYDSGTSPNRTTIAEDYIEAEGTGLAQHWIYQVSAAGGQNQVYMRRGPTDGRIEMTVTNADGSIARTVKILDDTGLSDFARPAVQVGGALPTTDLYDGREVIYIADSTNGVAWHLRYRAGAPGLYKWHVIGGSPLQVGPLQQNAGGDTYNNGAGYLAASNTGGTGPNITIPLPGDYDVTMSAYMRHGAASGSVWMSFSPPGGVAALDIDALYITMSAGNIPDVRMEKTVRKTGFATGTLSARYKAAGGSSVGLFDERILRAMPVRVG